MAVPRNRHSNARKKKKRAHQAMSPVNLIACKHCGTSRLAHRLCMSCGHYGGRNVIQNDAAPA